MGRASRKKNRVSNPNVQLPHDAVIEILARLPVKTLLVFKTVCSSWRRTIESPYFCRLQGSHCSSHDSEEKVLMKDSLFFYVADVNTLYVRRIVPGFEFPCIIGKRSCHVYSSNGILLLVHEADRKMLLWNPVTGKHKNIPYPPDSGSDYDIFSAYYQFYGLWYDSVSGNRFRILTIRHFSEVSAFDSNSKSWKTIQGGFQFHIDYGQLNSKAFIHGGFHVAGFRDCANRYRIFSFSPEGEVIGVFRPPPVRNHDLTLTTNVWEGRLCLQALVSNACKHEVWNMEEYGKYESWKKVASLQISGDSLYSLQPNGSLLLVRDDDVCVKDSGRDEVILIPPSIQGYNNMKFVGNYTYTPSLLIP